MMMVVFTIFLLGGWRNCQAGDLPYPIFVFRRAFTVDNFFAGTRSPVRGTGVVGIGGRPDHQDLFFPRLAVPFLQRWRRAGWWDFAIAFRPFLIVMMLLFLLDGRARPDFHCGGGAAA